MKDLKLSLHPGEWRMALTSQTAGRILPAEQDRVIRRWTRPAEIIPGWRQAATIVIPHSSLHAARPHRPPSKGRIARYPPPAPGRAIRFDVILGASQRANLAVENVTEVGQIRLRSGARVAIVAKEVKLHAGFEDYVSEGRKQGREPGTGWSWTSGPDGAPMLIDLGLVGPEQIE
jgi:hypothetical protein